MLQYDFLEKQLDKKEDKSKSSGGGLFHKSGRNDKLSSKSSSLDISTEDDSSKQQHIYKEMVELKSTLDEIDKGDNPTQNTRLSVVLLFNYCPAELNLMQKFVSCLRTYRV